MKTKLLKGLKFIFVVSVCFFCISGYKVNEQVDYKIQLDFNGKTTESVQLFYDVTGEQQWTEENSAKISKVQKEWQRADDIVDSNIKFLRIDFDNIDSENIHSTYYLRNLAIDQKTMYIFDSEEIISHIINLNQVSTSLKEDGSIEIVSTGTDPYIVLDISEYHDKVKDLHYTSFLYYLILSVVIWVFLRKIPFCFNSILESFKNLKKNKTLILKLAFNDFKTKYASSYLGIIWGFINPSITILVYWFVFQVAFKSGDIDNIPYILWFLCAIVPWFYFSEALNAATNSFIEYSYLVKKVKFNIDILPFIKIISSLFVHLFFIGVVFIVMSMYGYYPNVYNLQVFYYVACMLLLVYAITLFTSSVVLFFRDLGQIITIIVNVGFWFTPIGWNLAIIPTQFQLYLKMNPMYYIVQGFRDSFVANHFFWERPYQTVYFWFFVLLMMFMGVVMFKKLRPHFADVL